MTFRLIEKTSTTIQKDKDLVTNVTLSQKPVHFLGLDSSHLNKNNTSSAVYYNSTAALRTVFIVGPAAALIAALLNPALIPLGFTAKIVAEAVLALIPIVAIVARHEEPTNPLQRLANRANDGQLNPTDKILLTLITVLGIGAAAAVAVAFLAPTFLPLALAGLVTYSLLAKAAIGVVGGLSAGLSAYWLFSNAKASPKSNNNAEIVSNDDSENGTLDAEARSPR